MVAKAKPTIANTKTKPQGAPQKRARIQAPFKNLNNRPSQPNGQVKRAKQGQPPKTDLPNEPPPLPLTSVPEIQDSKALPILAASFSSLVALIPPKYYLPQNDLLEDNGQALGSEVQNARFHKNVRNGQPNKKAQAKAARVAKLDPANQKSVEQVAAERAAEESQDDASDDDDEDGGEEGEEDSDDNDSLPFAVDDDDESDMDDEAGRKRKRGSDEESDDDDDDDDDDDGVNEEGEEDDEADESQASQGAGASIGDLRTRLHDRIASLQKQRGLKLEEEDTPEQAAERKRRGEMRDRRRRERKEARRATAAASTPKDQKDQSSKPQNIVKPQGGGRNTAPALLVPGSSKAQDAKAEEAAKRAREAYEIDTSAADIQYGGAVDDRVQKLAKEHHLPRDPKTALNMLQARKTKAERMAEKRRAKRGESAEDSPQKPKSGPSDAAWDKAAAAAAGVRVRDDEAMLKQAAARKDRVKAKGKLKWNERTKGVEEAQAARQAKREENLKIRQQSKKSHKPHPKDTKKTSSASRPGSAAKAKSGRPAMDKKAQGKKGGKGGRK